MDADASEVVLLVAFHEQASAATGDLHGFNIRKVLGGWPEVPLGQDTIRASHGRHAV